MHIPQRGSHIIATISLQSLSAVAGFLSNWVEKSQNLNIGGIRLDFKEKKASVMRNVTPMLGMPMCSGIAELRFKHTLEGEYATKTLIAPLHKLLQAIKWDIATNTPTVFRIDDKGQVYLQTRGNTIFLSSEWQSNSVIPLARNTAIGTMEELLRRTTPETTLGSITLHSTDPVISLGSVLKAAPLYATEVALGKVDPGITYFSGFSQQHPFYDPVLDKEYGDTGPMAVSYSRMSLVMSRIPLEVSTANASLIKAVPNKKQGCPWVSSVDVSFLQDIQLLVRSIAIEAQKEGVEDVSITLSFHMFNHSTDSSTPILRIVSADDTYRFIFSVPAPIGLSPPSEEDILSIIPDLKNVAQEGVYTFSLERQKLIDTLEFWDQLFKTEGKSVIMPLRPISLQIDFEQEQLFLKNAGMETGSANSALISITSFTRPISGTAPAFLVPMDILLRVLQNPLFIDDEIEKISFTHAPGVLVFSLHNALTKRLSIALIAKFVE